MVLLLIKPAEVMLFLAGADTLALHPPAMEAEPSKPLCRMAVAIDNPIQPLPRAAVTPEAEPQRFSTQIGPRRRLEARIPHEDGSFSARYMMPSRYSSWAGTLELWTMRASTNTFTAVGE